MADRSVTPARAEPDLVGSCTLTAEMAWDPALAGGVYLPLVSIVPMVAFPPVTPSTFQVTSDEPQPAATVAANTCFCDVVKATCFGVTATETSVMNTWMVAVRVWSALDRADTAMPRDPTRALGAVYVAE